MATLEIVDHETAVHYEFPFEVHEEGAHKELKVLRNQVRYQIEMIERLEKKVKKLKKRLHGVNSKAEDDN